MGEDRFGDDDDKVGSDDLLLVPMLELFRGVMVEPAMGALLHVSRLEIEGVLVSLGAPIVVAIGQGTCEVLVAVIDIPWLETSGIFLVPRGMLVEICGIVLALE